ncbi:LmbE family N-acetylglucosaminyl deacetylase [Sphingomonas insulae]|uniref:PIG-L family deacetylase n=1 Tax=Sphingomonas insulae TaxID=424800 RepID=A0ABN1HQE5_9SPHN|nr:PIG-L deacetylase family protein [Sphingomonas insulae]NIJ29406.1 LmbE family N-acetylglucosaminyl deacetylase [Sphingomonas insulae]
MRLRLGRPRHAVVIAPHPDDEVIGAAALIGALRRRGCRVTIVIVSDGAASHPGSRRWPAARLIAERYRESRRALRRLGVPAGAVRTLGLPDGAVSAHLPACTLALRRIVADADLIVAPAIGDAHPDHRAVAMALRRVPGGARRLAYQVWPPRSLDRGRGRGRTLAAPGGSAGKRSLIRLHRTQLGAISDDPAGFAIARHELDAFCYPLEAFVELCR